MTTREPKSIIVGIDGSKVAQQAAQFAAEIAQGTHSSLELVFVRQPRLIPPVAEYSAVLTQTEEADQGFAEECLRHARAQLPPMTPEPVLTVLTGNIVDELLKRAEAIGASMVVVGSRGKGALERIAFGSSADGLVHASKRPVLVFHPR